MGPIGCSEKSVRNYHYMLCNNPEEGRSFPLFGSTNEDTVLVVGTAYPWTHCMLKYRLEKPAISVFRAEVSILRYTLKKEKESHYAIPALIC
jgi:hypothetical protein